MSPIALPIVVPLVAAGLSMALMGRLRLQRILAFVASSATLAASVWLLLDVESSGTVVSVAGGWPAGPGIAVVADELAAILLVVAEIMLLGVLTFAVGQRETDRRTAFFHPVYHVLAAGVAMSFLTGDLFTLFVGFEVMLMASYVLLTVGAGGERVRAAMSYVVVNLLASALFLTTIALVYAATGTVNLADLATRLGEVPAGLRTLLGAMTLVVFGIKAAVFPLFSWLPDSYPTAPTPVTAIFAGLLTKVGVYAILRTRTLLFPEDGPSPLVLGIAVATMLVGVLGAIAQDDIKRILSFHIVSQIGYMIMGIGLATLAGIAATVLYVVHHIVVKTTLFLVAGLVETRAGTGALHRVGGLARTAPVLGLLFAPAALSLAGLPPFSGFVAKYGLVRAGMDAGQWVVVGVALAVSLLTFYSMAKIWAGAFWGEPEEEPERAPRRPTAPMIGATTALVVIGIAIAVFAGPLYDFAERAAVGLLDPASYIGAVIGS
jgi:multicomponent Na+:H+ antiporter subunit D